MEQNIMKLILEGTMKPTNLSLETLRKITDDFSPDRVIGEGGFGKVYKGDIGNWNVAVKRIRSNMAIKQKLFRREVDSLMEVNHQNVVRFLGLCSHTVEKPMKNPESSGFIYVEIRERLLCFEYISNGSLDTKITDELRGLEWNKRYQIIKGICAGLHYLHTEKRILHMDLKPSNILLDNQMVPKITDFGLSRPVENSQTTTESHFVTLGYTAPENLLSPGRMTVKSDIYSLGVIIIELVSGQKAITEIHNNNIVRRWRHRWNKSANEAALEYHRQVITCIEIGLLCQKINPYARPTTSEIMGKFVELESMHNSRSAYELTEINPLYREDDMLGIEPLELRFGHTNKNQQILSCSVELSNNTDGFIAFYIQTTNMLPYTIDPNKDIVKPRSKCKVDITLPAANARDHKASRQYNINKLCTEEFIVRSSKVKEELTTQDIAAHMFDEHTMGHHVDEIIMAVVSEEPYREEIMSRRIDGPVIGIDLGTTNSCVGVWKNGRVEIIANEHGNRTTPSCVAFKDSRILIGETAINQALHNPANTVCEMKQLIGRRFSDAFVRSNTKLLPFEVIAGPDDMPKIRVSHRGKKEEFSPEQISAMVLGKMKETAEIYLGQPIKNAVVTVPAYFNNSQRKATKDAGIIAGLDVIRIISEPTAATIACIHGNKNCSSKETYNALIFDLGSGKIDVSIVSVKQGIPDIKATAGSTHLGGQAFTNNIFDHCVKECKEKHNMDITCRGRNSERDVLDTESRIRRVKNACETSMKVLSYTTEAIIVLDTFFIDPNQAKIDFSTTISRTLFEHLNQDLFLKCMDIVKKCLDDAKMDKSQVDDVVLIGGSTHIPRIQQLIQEFFDGKKLCMNINPEEGVAYGATILAAKIMIDKQRPDPPVCIQFYEQIS